jgi:subtilisin-like proprotein convertase family protein
MNKRLPAFLFLILLAGCNKTAETSGDTFVTTVAGEDPLASYAWHLQNTGQTSFSTSSGIAGQDQKIYNVHAAGIKGNGIKIAVSDTGVDNTHPDLTNMQVSGEHRDYSTDTTGNWRNGNPYPIEHEGHGTAVAGLSAAQGWNSIGSRGVAPSAKFGGFLFVGDFQQTSTSYTAKTVDQMTGNFDIFNYSYGYVGCEFIPASASILNAYKTGVTTLRSGKGAIYVKAAGNDYLGFNTDCDSTAATNSYFIGNTNTSEDQNNPYIITAAAVNARGVISSYSTPGSGVWVSSAGGEFGTSSPAMISTDILGCSYGIAEASTGHNSFDKGLNTLNSRCDYTSTMNGTSSATPTLSGIIALMLEANPALTWRDVKHILAVTADKINLSYAAVNHPRGTGAAYTVGSYVYDYAYVRNFAGKDFSNTYGFGRANAEAAVNMAQTYTSTLGTYVETDWTTNTSGTINLAIPDHSATGVESTITVATTNIIESVQIKVSITHNFLGDLALELKSPKGTTSRLLHVNSNINDANLSDFTLLSNAFYGEPANGVWTVKVVDGATGHTGNLTNWKIRINGHAP